MQCKLGGNPGLHTRIAQNMKRLALTANGFRTHHRRQNRDIHLADGTFAVSGYISPNDEKSSGSFRPIASKSPLF
jgi:hypothetical protein